MVVRTKVGGVPYSWETLKSQILNEDIEGKHLIII